MGALFRVGNEWAVFVVRHNRTRMVQVKLGHRNDNDAEVMEGLKEGDRVILYPGDRIDDGVSVSERLVTRGI